MKISTSKHNTFNYKVQEFNSLSDLVKLVTSGKNYSCGVFKNGHRNNENFLETYTIGLDIDNGIQDEQMTIIEAIETFKDYKHVIMPSKSHQKEKHGIVADRFRVILFLTNPIKTQKDYVATWDSLKTKYPAIDKQCKDPARFWYPSPTAVSKNEKGKTIDVVKYVEKVKGIKPEELTVKGKLSRNTLEFINFGAENGLWNKNLTKATIDIREQGYSKEEAVSLLEKPTGHLDEEDLRCIDSIYSKEMRYEARDDGSSFNFKSIGDVLNNKEKLEWTADRLLIKAGLSIFAGRPKSGKSTVVRQLVKNMINGEEFFGRKTEAKQVLYFALEEHELMLKEQFNQVGIKDGDPINIHIGMFKNFTQRYENLEKAILETNSDFVVLDTMALFCGIGEINNYNDVNLQLTKLREISRNTGAHIMVIHHLSKGSKERRETVLGSTAITGAVDNILSLTRKGNERFFSSQGRGCHGFFSHPLLFDWDKQTYSLGEKEDEEF